jgi:hypothetical protein
MFDEAGGIQITSTVIALGLSSLRDIVTFLIMGACSLIHCFRETYFFHLQEKRFIVMQIVPFVVDARGSVDDIEAL